MENKELSGAMFPNTKTTEKSPDLRGSVKVCGIDYEVAGWKRKSKNGLAYISLALQKKGERVTKSQLRREMEELTEKIDTADMQEQDPLPF